MATEEGMVTRVEDSIAWVKVSRTADCKACAQRGACGVTTGKGETEVRARNTAGAKVGDAVVVSIETSTVLKFSFLLYVLPVIFMIIGALLGREYALSNALDESLCSMIAGLAFFAIPVLAVRLKHRRLASNEKYTPAVTGIKRRA